MVGNTLFVLHLIGNTSIACVKKAYTLRLRKARTEEGDPGERVSLFSWVSLLCCLEQRQAGVIDYSLLLGIRQEPIGVSGPVHIEAHDLIGVIDSEGSRVCRAREAKLGEGLPAQQEAKGVSIGFCQEAGHIAVIVDAGGRSAGRVGRDDLRKLAGFSVQQIGVVDPVPIGVEADRDAVLVDAEQLIDGACVGIGVSVGIRAIIAARVGL